MTGLDQPQPRWTVDQGPVLVWNDRVLPVPVAWPDGEQAYDALVRAVEDAATFARARDRLFDLLSEDPS